MCAHRLVADISDLMLEDLFMLSQLYEQQDVELEAFVERWPLGRSQQTHFSNLANELCGMLCKMFTEKKKKRGRRMRANKRKREEKKQRKTEGSQEKIQRKKGQRETDRER